ncbi:unnamed protein product [Diabrotica balteata]|uniref:Nardilysin n=1 Tax=Diabrotica balteata TaxID=107213 RepID=A0A9N9STD1_DIABA|nr:unnamed protein product [Diabrotica balteata]
MKLFKYILQNPLIRSVSATHITPTTSILRRTTMDTPQFEILPSPIQGESDEKEYRVIKLKNNLVACLISDKAPISKEEMDMDESGSESDNKISDSESDSECSDSSSEAGETTSTPDQKMAAAALCIGVGSFSDPKEVPGMAHFLEHMVFMGSEKFPAENDFDSFIKKCGGTDNASTDMETTCYYFECLEKRLHEALDKFAQFFISPLMKKGAMTREREAIESEFQMALPSDPHRREQLLLQLAKPESPVNAFGWGNLKTLRDDISDDKLYEGVHAFRKRHYSAHRMTLAIQARLPLDTLQEYVVECFSNVPNNHLDKDDFSAFKEGVFDTPEFNRIYYIKPLQQLIKVDLNWSLPSLKHMYKSKPMGYVSSLLGDEGKGSLLSYLKSKSWATSIQAGNEDSGGEHNSMYAIFNVSIGLTENGLVHIYNVIEAVFSYINMLRNVGPQRRLFDEQKLIADTTFRFASEQTPVDNVENLCEAMQFYPPEDYLAGSELFYEYDPKAITMVTDSLVPKKVNIMITTKDLPKGLVFDKTEKWFKAEYTSIEIPKDRITQWETVKPYPELNIPPVNPYLSTNFSLLPKSPKHPDYPQKIMDTPKFEMWYRKDEKFKLPMAYYHFYLINPSTLESAKSLVLTEMFMNLLSFAIGEEVYPANMANIQHQFTCEEKGIVIKIGGFNEKIPNLIEVVAKYVKNLQNYINECMFLVIKETMLKYYFNKILKPANLAKDTRLKLLIGQYFAPVDKYGALLDITYADVQEFIHKYIKNFYVKALVQGNVLPEVASDTIKTFVNTLNYDPLPQNQYPALVVAQIPLGEKCLKVESFNKRDSNSITANYYQVGPYSLKDSVMIDIIMFIIEEPLFDILRTKEQLGYHVYCALRDTYGVLGYSITVNSQANKFTTQHLDNRIEEFLKHTETIIEKSSQKEYEEMKQGLIETKEIVDSHLKEEVDRNWTEIVNDDYMFDRSKQEIEEIKQILQEDVKNWWNRHNYFGTKSSFRKISVQVVGHVPDDASKGEPVESSFTKKIELTILDNEIVEAKGPDYFISNIDQFRSKLQLYPARVKK